MGSICILPNYFLDLETHNCRSYVYSSVLMVVEFEFRVVIGCSLYCTAHELPHQSLCIVAAVAISLDQMDFNIQQNSVERSLRKHELYIWHYTSGIFWSMDAWLGVLSELLMLLILIF